MLQSIMKKEDMLRFKNSNTKKLFNEQMKSMTRYNSISSLKPHSLRSMQSFLEQKWINVPGRQQILKWTTLRMSWKLRQRNEQ